MIVRGLRLTVRRLLRFLRIRIALMRGVQLSLILENEDALTWIQNGRLPPPPAFIKRETIREIAEKYGCKLFVETGTYLGDTVNSLKSRFQHLYTVEIDPVLYGSATERFRNDKHVSIFHGDSAVILKGLVSKLDWPACFWLDGHYSAGVTGRGTKDTPIEEELESILNSPLEHIILIDDARCFNGTGDYPPVSRIRDLVLWKRPNYVFWVQDDIIRAMPWRTETAKDDCRKREFARWTKDKGEVRLRYRYRLARDAVVWDVGAFDGDFTEEARQCFSCKVDAFEPAADKQMVFAERFSVDKHVRLHPYGLAASERAILLSNEADGSSLYGEAKGGRTALLRSVVEVFNELGGSGIDLCKINIEGGEYELLDEILSAGISKSIRYFQIQFHPWYPFSQDRVQRIREGLARTHRCQWRYDYIWESWERK